mmetsp:Transcript_28804/g.69745  ORF Transcript_28804/g.69745 Transcript_28804/m.69745 type:complete len:176 (+) Transcript_28804:552-1079(+)
MFFGRNDNLHNGNGRNNNSSRSNNAGGFVFGSGSGSGRNNNQSDDMDEGNDYNADDAGAGSNPLDHHHEVFSPPTNHGDQPPPPMDTHTPSSAAGRSLIARVNSQGAAHGTPNARIEQAADARTSGSHRVTFDERENALQDAQNSAKVLIRNYNKPAMVEELLDSGQRHLRSFPL